MRIQASAKGKNNLFQEDGTGVSKLTLTADTEFDRRLLTSLMVLKSVSPADNRALWDQCVVFLQTFANSYPRVKEETT